MASGPFPPQLSLEGRGRLYKRLCAPDCSPCSPACDAYTSGPGLAPLPSFRETQRLLGFYQPCPVTVPSLPSAELSELADQPALLILASEISASSLLWPIQAFMATFP